MYTVRVSDGQLDMNVYGLSGGGPAGFLHSSYSYRGREYHYYSQKQYGGGSLKV